MRHHKDASPRRPYFVVSSAAQSHCAGAVLGAMAGLMCGERHEWKRRCNNAIAKGWWQSRMMTKG